MGIRAYRKALNAAVNFMPFGPATSQFSPPTAGEASEWMTLDMTIYEATLKVPTALAGAEQRTLLYINNTTQTGNTITLEDADSVRGTVDAVLPAAQNAGFAESDIARSGDSGSPPVEDMFIGTFYRDDAAENLTYHGFGSATFNHGIGASAEYFGVETTRTTLTESQARCIIGGNGKLKNFTGRYGTAGSDFQLDVMVNGVAFFVGAFPDDAAERFLFATEIDVVAGDEVSFRITRTAGSNTQFVISCHFAFEPATS